MRLYQGEIFCAAIHYWRQICDGWLGQTTFPAEKSAASLIIIIKIFVKCKIMSTETILSVHTPTHTCVHTQAPAHTSILTAQKLNLHSLDTWGGWRQHYDTENTPGLQFWENKCYHLLPAYSVHFYLLSPSASILCTFLPVITFCQHTLYISTFTLSPCISELFLQI